MLYFDLNNFKNNNVFKDSEKAVKLLETAKLNKNSINKVMNMNEDNYTKISASVLIKVSFALNNRFYEFFDKEISYELKDFDDEEFLSKNYIYDHNLKASYLYSLSQSRNTKTSVEKGRNTLRKLEGLEKKFGKSVIDFNKDESVEMLNYFRGLNHNYDTYRYMLKEASSFLVFVKDNFNKYTDYAYELTWEFDKLIKTVPEGERINRLITKELLHEIAYAEESVQNAIIPILLFDGAKLAREDKDNELTYIKRYPSHEGWAKIEIETGSFKRVIDVPEEDRQILEVASKTDEIFQSSSRARFAQLADSPYLLRPFIESSRSGIQISEQAIQKRLRSIKSDFDYLIGDREFTATSIRAAGKINNIEKLVKDGMEITLAIRQTLYVFGEVTIDELNAPTVSPSLAQKTNRLKNNYLLYFNKK